MPAFASPTSSKRNRNEAVWRGQSGCRGWLADRDLVRGVSTAADEVVRCQTCAPAVALSVATTVQLTKLTAHLDVVDFSTILHEAYLAVFFGPPIVALHDESDPFASTS